MMFQWNHCTQSAWCVDFYPTQSYIYTMDDEALQGLQSLASRIEQTRALQYFEQLKASSDGWKLTAQALTSGSYEGNDHVKFFCLQVIEYYLRTRYGEGNQEEHALVKNLIARLLQLQGQRQDKSFLRNKVSQIISLAFVIDYPVRWVRFFSDLLQSLSIGHLAVDMYLRILLQIDSEVVDREIVHTPQETDRNTRIKDAMRDHSVLQLAESWLQIMNEYSSTQPEIVCMCLDVVGKYISWIDIGLIANDKFVPVIIRFMSMPLLRESACDCIHEIISKGMDPVAKTKLVESFTDVLENVGVLNLSEDEDGDFLAKMAKLINCMGVQLISSWQKLLKVDAQKAGETLVAVENKVSLLFRFLGDEDDDVSGAVATFTTDYISLLKQMDPITPKQRENIEALLYILIKKMKFDESYNFEHEGEDEAMFMEYRKQLKTIFTNLASLDSQLVLITVHNIVTHTLSQWKNMELKDIEVAITLLYTLAEALPSSQGQHFTGDVTKATALQEMMRLLITSRVSCQGHMIVMIHFFETVVRYEKFFQCEPQHVPDVLMAFMDERGFHHRSSQVRSRASYLFSRFVKGLKGQINNYIDDIFKRIGDLLVLNTPDNGYQHLLSNDDQLFVYETAGSLIVSSNFPPEKKSALMKQVLAPIAAKFALLMEKMIAEKDENKQLAYAQSINNAMALASRASKGFSSQQTMQNCGCEGVFVELLQIFIQAVTVPVHRQLIHVGVRQYMHRMVVCLEKEILPFVPVVLENLLKQPDARELHDFIPLMNQMIMKFKSAISPFLQEVFMPVVSTIFRVLTQPTDDLDQVAVADKRSLQKSYYQFISTIVSNDVLDVLKNQEVHNLHQVLITIVQGATEFPDPSSQKTCFNILKRLVAAWGGKDGLQGFPDFVYKSIIPACFMAPMKPEFDLKDAQTTLALNEAALCLKCVLEQRGDEMINYLQGDYLPTHRLSPDQAREFCDALKSESKLFRNYFKTFFTKAKS
ncbi:exportin-T-like isoform X1 [Mercenaria mercenaria]|uniref:exportin-T-like isoform X1 n=2 Tax=Mercenaria mercenaria TaxID=6596 RepID=UPI00234EAAE6|nr:exportin-T-like isoform X1 [Mercenaria mercenaria]